MSNCNAPFVDDFQWAVIRLATLQRRGQPGRLIFATVTLLSPDRPPPTKMTGADSQKLGKSGMTVFFRRTVLNARQAIDWYRSLGESNSKAPVPSRREDLWRNDGIDITVSDLVDDPLWPNLGLPMGESLLSQPTGKSDPAPFIGSIPSRIHRRFGNAEGFETLIANDAVLAFIARRLHINLRDYPEYLGSAALIVPNHIIKQIDNFLIPANDEHGEQIFYRFVPRSGQTLDGLNISMFDTQAYLLTGFETRNVPINGILQMDKGSCIGAYGYVVTHPVHGVLSYHLPSGFLRTMNLNIGIVNQVRKISVPVSESQKSTQTEYCVHRTQRVQNSVIGDETIPSNANLRVGIAGKQREKAANAVRYDQHWFGEGKREEAMAFVRTRVSRARNLIMVADPYFGVLQIPQYLLAITSDTVKVKILTSRLAFEGGYTPEEGCQEKESSLATNSVERLNRFSEEIERVRKEGNADVEVMILPGKSPVLHDRFLVIDDEIWFLGNSLNTLGERASMIIKLPNPDEVLRELENMLNQANTFDAYRQQRTNA
ncbi:VPA1262 family N-terminal domain-containing protein [Methylobacter sp.]|uniref:VPA1262 family N-terminal domain-containing protein n=1 Tax=Methylobacter sp. TaxID=2051955 RepID=UPI00248920E3|nr:VPA1262 family N-terminal domain-containing protein [Methylobacter sp.]MDI1278011.1 VPA1262 family N-terminal domain-containing protein [Methylobacter sp.]MDI1358849.1 VPA1262 family N-terminal domain-containing protein [Methylobacter sp.]